MFCTTCGTANADNGRFCSNCGANLLAATVVVNPRQVLATPAQPAAQPPPPAVLPTTPPPAAAPLPYSGPQTSGKAITSLILSLANGLFFFCFFPLAIAAIIFGHISRSEIKKSNGRLGGAGMALAGLIIGYCSLALLPGIIAAIAIPNLLMARSAANEASAVGSVRTINTAAISYEATYAKGFPASLAVMGRVAGQPAGENSAELIDDVLASGTKSGYRFTYTPGEPGAGGVVASYTIQADPVSPGAGHRHFFSDETAVIRYELGQPATAQSPPLD